MASYWTFPFTSLLQSFSFAAGIIGIWELAERLRIIGKRVYFPNYLLDTFQFLLPLLGLMIWHFVSGSPDLWMVVIYSIGTAMALPSKRMKWLFGLSALTITTLPFSGFPHSGAFFYSIFGGILTILLAWFFLQKRQNPLWALYFSGLWIILAGLQQGAWLDTADEWVKLFSFTIPMYIYFSECGERNKLSHESHDLQQEASPNQKIFSIVDGMKKTILQLPVGMVVTSPEYVILEVNNEMEAMSGYARIQLLGKKPSMLASAGMDNRALYDDMRAHLANSGLWEGRFINQKPTGELWNANVKISTIYDDTTILGYFALITASDITDSETMLPNMA